MTPLRMTLKTSGGQDVQLRAGREMGWPDTARMDWVRVVDGAPEVVTATLALRWFTGETRGSVMCAVDWPQTECWEGHDPDVPMKSEDDSYRCAEWADTFCAGVNKALADTAALTLYADLHWHETEAAKTWWAIGAAYRGRLGARFSLAEKAATAGEDALMTYVWRGVIEAAQGRSTERAWDRFLDLGGKKESERLPGPRDVSPEMLKQATAPVPCWCTNCTALFIGIPHKRHEGCEKQGMARMRVFSTTA